MQIQGIITSYALSICSLRSRWIYWHCWWLQVRAQSRDKQIEERMLSHRQDDNNRHATRHQVWALWKLWPASLRSVFWISFAPLTVFIGNSCLLFPMAHQNHWSCRHQLEIMFGFQLVIFHKAYTSHKWKNQAIYNNNSSSNSIQIFGYLKGYITFTFPHFASLF